MRSFSAGVLLLVLACAGCGNNQAAVSGQVTYKGQPLPNGAITFIDANDASRVFAAPIVDGKYNVPNAPIGPSKVTVTTPASSAAAKPKAAPPGVTYPVEVAKIESVAIPTKYADPSTSGLTYTVEAGSQTKDFSLE